MTDEECRLWVCLQHDFPWKFRRQEPIGPYICDFVCYPKRLVVEVDGSQHGEGTADVARDAFLARLGFRVVRVWNDAVRFRLEEALNEIDGALSEQPDLHRNRPPRNADD